MIDVVGGKRETGLHKRSIKVAGHSTSISLEAEFWQELKLIAEKRGKSLNQLISHIDEQRRGNLSSALRLFVLAELKRLNCP